MKIPNHIRKKMNLTALYASKAANLNKQVSDWLESHGVDVDALSDGSGCGFEELMYGRNITDELCERIEREAANVDVSQT